MYDSKYVYYFIATAIKWIQSDWAIDMAEASYAVWEKKSCINVSIKQPTDLMNQQKIANRL